MGRKPSRNKNLPQGMRARHRTSGTYYYLDTSGTPRREIALGSDYALAVKKWAELTVNAQPRHTELITFVMLRSVISERYCHRKRLEHNKITLKNSQNYMNSLIRLLPAEQDRTDSYPSVLRLACARHTQAIT